MERKKRRMATHFRCHICNQVFDKLNQLSVHARKEHKQSTKTISQLTPLSHNIINAERLYSRMRQLDSQCRVSLRWCLPDAYDWVRIWKVQETPLGVQIFIEPLQVKKLNLPISPPKIKKVYK